MLKSQQIFDESEMNAWSVIFIDKHKIESSQTQCISETIISHTPKKKPFMVTTWIKMIWTLKHTIRYENKHTLFLLAIYSKLNELHATQLMQNLTQSHFISTTYWNGSFSLLFISILDFLVLKSLCVLVFFCSGNFKLHFHFLLDLKSWLS